jgi:transposase
MHSALYSQDKLRQSGLFWLTLAPENIALVKHLVQADEKEYAWQTLQDGYKGVLIGQNARGLKQRYLLVHSAQAEKRESITLEKRIEKGLKKAEKSAAHLSRQAFGCEQDAIRTAKTIEKSMPYHWMNYHVTKILKYKGPQGQEVQMSRFFLTTNWRQNLQHVLIKSAHSEINSVVLY